MMGWESTTTARGDGDGLIGMRDRVGAVGVRLEIVSSPGQGTTVRGTIPGAVTPRADDTVPPRSPHASAAPRRSHPEKRHRQPTPAKRRPPNGTIGVIGPSSSAGMLDHVVGDKAGRARGDPVDDDRCGRTECVDVARHLDRHRREPRKAHLQRAYQGLGRSGGCNTVCRAGTTSGSPGVVTTAPVP